MAGGADAFQNRGGVGLSPSLSFGVVGMFGVAFDAVEFADSIKDIFGEAFCIVLNRYRRFDGRQRIVVINTDIVKGKCE